MNIRNLLGRGIGVHHGGLLPIVKEVSRLCSYWSKWGNWVRSPRPADCWAAIRSRLSQSFVRDWNVCHGSQYACKVCGLLRDSETWWKVLSRSASRRIVSWFLVWFDAVAESTLFLSTQMSGRAGRRGLDKTGTVIIVVGDNDPPDVCFVFIRLDVNAEPCVFMIDG